MVSIEKVGSDVGSGSRSAKRVLSLLQNGSRCSLKFYYLTHYKTLKTRNRNIIIPYTRSSSLSYIVYNW